MEHAPAWLTNSLIYLSAAVLVVPLSKALGLGSIIGYLVAGIAIGPWGLGLVSSVEDVLHFAEFGVVLMLFLVGLELEPRRLWNLRRPIFGWGTAQVLSCAAVLFAVGCAVGAEWRVALVAALGLALSSTAIALQVFGERNLLKTPSGQAGFSILLFQDVAAIPILALLPLLAGATAAEQSITGLERALEAAKIIGVIGGIILGGRLLLRPILRWIARSDTPEIFTAAALLLVVAIAALMQLVGLSMALGAFLAGVLLAESEYRRELETDIEPFKGLLLGLFFIAVGMSINFGVLVASPWIMAMLVVGFVAIKLVVIYALAKAMGIAYQERPVFTLLLAQGGEFAFVVFQAAGPDVLPPQVTSLLIGAVALSMLLSPLLLVLLDKFVLPRYSQGTGTRLEEISEQQDAKVLICGFGRYGQIVGRMLMSQGLRVTVLDHDADTVEGLRQFGFRVFYGDATRLDLLRTAGAGTAKVIVVAVDDIEQSLEIVDLVQENFGQARIIARARNVTHLFQLRDRGVTEVEREVFESSLRSARATLEALGWPAHEARESAMRFRRRNIKLSDEIYPHYKDRAKLIAANKAGRQQFEEQMAREREERQRRSGRDWERLEEEEQAEQTP
ncbi:glutathione-regulated potassium-efflux system protein KefC [Variovorax sp. NFACC27]|uniref:Glutathione-regulated potassium-efflux system protein KefC n=1 Tax=Variovorax gossypii TaxID=1679495 RepID=A0A431TJY8_9BURK|nr:MULTISPECIES: glutathione-regulated potassium-efflux system protein KefC [Variovorax]MDP9606031.1 glutathione-regulated potassium-efflux system ancillary protein KefC [Variovorax paradoxus]SEF29131.1 Kef-type potassium/proton antiporter, CPA2 family (TC 2.A.37.1) [Variovorax sp. NFACC28]SEG92450.1 Kef-type potassium/proton antiporter, CPA2 family (TC 2.A.37.1) [Variovorax sp. NFACC29]SFD65046.1 Kef-type potassium/proton antiporter, CPA2 family (TC 2.A.37.1) [Variovorax sp. NFACC26]SFG98370.